MNQTTISAPAGSSERLPLGGLLALAMATFITLLTEIMPAGVLSSIAGDLNVSESLAGQFITAYAVGALVAAIPLTALTQGMRRRPLLLSAIGGFAIVNLVTALSHDYHVSLATRFFAGVFALATVVVTAAAFPAGTFRRCPTHTPSFFSLFRSRSAAMVVP